MKKVIMALLLLPMFSMPAMAADSVALPKGYAKWEKSKQKVVTDKTSLFYGIHYLYVDPKAMKTYKSGGVYPDGSRFVVEFFNIKEAAGKPVPGKKSMIVLMKKDKKQTQTGGWLFAGFTAEGKPSGLDPVKTCFGCHLRDAKDRDYVISTYSDFK